MSTKGERRMEKNGKSFIMSMISTFFLLILFSGLVIVEKNTRKIAFGDSSPFFACEYEKDKLKGVNLHFMGKGFRISLRS